MEQADAVALLALAMQQRFRARTPEDRQHGHLSPLVSKAHNHHAIWFVGGSVGKTRTLELVVQPLTETFFDPESHGASAQSNYAAQNLGLRGRILHSANGLFFEDSRAVA